MSSYLNNIIEQPTVNENIINIVISVLPCQSQEELTIIMTRDKEGKLSCNLTFLTCLGLILWYNIFMRNARGIKLVLKNRKVRFDYHILETYEAGIVLKGSEVKSIREGQISIKESYARLHRREMFIYNMDISAYRHSNISDYEPKRPRKLLLKRAEIERLVGKIMEKGLTLIPLSLYFKNGYAKLELGLARGTRLYDKRERIKKKIMSREMARVSKKGNIKL